ncbi:Hypothetical predicted protein, partial [Pelobates cultripes]
MADAEDHTQEQPHLRGVPETVLSADLPLYVCGLLHAYAPVILVDMLLVDRVHRVPKP